MGFGKLYFNDKLGWVEWTKTNIILQFELFVEIKIIFPMFCLLFTVSTFIHLLTNQHWTEMKLEPIAEKPLGNWYYPDEHNVNLL